MGFINLPATLQNLFSSLETRILKLETATRFTAPNVASDPSLPRKGDIVMNTTANQLKFVDNSGSFVSLAAASGGVTAVTATAPIVSSGGTTPVISIAGDPTFKDSVTVQNTTSGAAKIEVGGPGVTGNQYAYIDLTGDTTYSDYGIRIIRNNTGANTTSNIVHRGTGDFYFINPEAAYMKFQTSSVDRLVIEPTGRINLNYGTYTTGRARVIGTASDTSAVLELQSNDGGINYIYKQSGGSLVFSNASSTLSFYNNSGHRTDPLQPIWQSDITSATNSYSTFTAAQNIGFTATNSSTITVQTAGQYLVVAQQLVSTSGAGYFYLQQNNVSQKWGYISTTYFGDWGVRAILTCAAGDTIRLNMNITLSNQWNGGHSSLAIVKVA